jgi:hypothetical protein
MAGTGTDVLVGRRRKTQKVMIVKGNKNAIRGYAAIDQK